MKKRMLSALCVLCLTASLLPTTALAAGSSFTDVKADDYFVESVAWAVSNNITAGTSATTFSPNQTCTRAQILTFLWKAAGCPESPFYNTFNPFTDVSMTDYYYNAAVWAMEWGILDVTGTEMKPNTPCTRGSTAEYLWHFAKSAKTDILPFTDVPKGGSLEMAVSWAVDYGITAGTGGATFSPNSICTRAQIVTFLHRYFVKPLDNSEFVASLKPSTPAAPVDPMKLDPLPPVDYTKQADWYMSLTHVDDLSDARLLAEYESINNLIGDWRAREIFITDSVYARQLDLWAAAKNRGLL